MVNNLIMASAIVSIVLAIAIVGTVSNYTSIIVAKDAAIVSLANQKNQIQTWLNGNKTLLATATEHREQLQTQMTVTAAALAENIGFQTQTSQNQTSKPDITVDPCRLLHDSMPQNTETLQSPPEPPPCK